MKVSCEEQVLLKRSEEHPADYSSVGRRTSITPTPNERAAIEKVLTTTEERRGRESMVLLSALLFCFVFMVLEFVCGVWAHSLALLTDASHLLIDVGAYALSIMSLKAASKSSCRKYNYGWHRAEVIGTLVSVFSIWALVAWIVIEGLTRIWDVVECSRTLEMQPKQSTLTENSECKEVDSPIMMLVGVLGMVVNMVCAAILYCGGSHGHSHLGGMHDHSHGEPEIDRHQDHHAHSDGGAHAHVHGHGDAHGHTHGASMAHEEAEMHTKKKKSGFAIHAALLHALGDCIQSVGVILAGVVMYMANRYTYGMASYRHSIYNIADPLCSLLFAVITLYMTKSLIGDLLGILMESTPPGVNYAALENALRSIDGVVSVHDLHVWSLSSEYMALSVHLVADDAETALRKAQYICEILFGIGHTTIQVDTVANGADLCQASCISPTIPL